MTLRVLDVSRSSRLGPWGTLELTGASSALLRLVLADDIALPDTVAEDLTGSTVLLNEQEGRLVVLPYAAELVAGYDLKFGEPLYPPIILRRASDYGLRMGTARVILGLGALHLTESTLSLFRDDCSLAWSCEDDFQGWTIEALTPDAVRLLSGDWAGRQERQVRSLANGALMD